MAVVELILLQITSVYHNLITLPLTYLNFDLFGVLLQVNFQNTFNFIVDRHPHPFYSFAGLRSGWVMVTQLFNNSFTYSFQMNNELSLATSNVRGDSSLSSQSKMLEENTQDYRSVRSQNPVFKPDFKSGNFFTRDDFARKPFLLTTISDITKGMRRPVWFLSDVYTNSLETLKKNYFNLVKATENPLSGDTKVSDTFIQNPYGIFQTFHLFKTSRIYSTPQGDLDVTYPFINQRWLNLGVMEQKFYRMYNTTSTQQRVVAN